jgi:sterol 14alpha-demethylase
VAAPPRPPQLPGGLPWLGHALALRRDPVGLLRRGRARFGEIFGFRLAGRDVTAFVGPGAQAAFFAADESQLSPREVYQFTVPVFGPGVVYDVRPEILDEQMGLLVPALRDERLRAYARVMRAEVEAYVEAWGDEGEVDLLVALNELTVFIASHCLIGEEFRRRLSKEFADLYRDLEGGITLLAFVNPYLPLPAFRRRDRARARVTEMISGVIAERRARGLVGEDFLQTLMEARYVDGQGLRDEVIAGLLLSVIFAGQHTSAVMAAWTGILLLEHPEFLLAVLAEQEAVLGRQEMTVGRLRDLVALERAVKEAERMHPPLILLMRLVVRDFAVGEYVIPAGGLAMVSPAAAHRLPEVFADPDRYDPERFAPPRLEDRRVRHGLIGFGGGHHRCIGSTFALQQIKIIWSVLFQRFELSLARSGHQPDYTTFVVGPRAPCCVRYRRRRHLLVAVPDLVPAIGSEDGGAVRLGREAEEASRPRRGPEV